MRRWIPLTVGLALAALLAAMKLLEFAFFSYRLNLETYLGLVALVFMSLGIGITAWIKRRPGKRQAHFEDDGILSRREREILERIAMGFTNSEIAESLCVSVNTIKTHTRNIYAKLGVSNRAEAVFRAKQKEELG